MTDYFDTDDLNYFDTLDELDTNELDTNELDTNELDTNELDTNAKVKHQYVNEHMLTILMSMFKNWDGNAHKSILFRPDYVEARKQYEVLKMEYEVLLKEGVDKRSQRIQKPFNEMLNLAIKMYPTDKEIAELYQMINLISQRCLQMYARNKGIENGDIVGTTFERWIKYRHSFEPLKRSDISGARVNAFAYMTQMVKNTIFEASNKIKRQNELVEELSKDMMLLESVNTNKVSVPLSEDSTNEFITFSTLDDRQHVDLDADIIRELMHRVHNTNNLKVLILGVESMGFSKDEIFRVIGEYNLMDALQDAIDKNKWVF